MVWIVLVIAGLFEIGFTLCFRLSQGFTKLAPTISFVIFAAVSFFLLFFLLLLVGSIAGLKLVSVA